MNERSHKFHVYRCFLYTSSRSRSSSSSALLLRPSSLNMCGSQEDPRRGVAFADGGAALSLVLDSPWGEAAPGSDTCNRKKREGKGRKEKRREGWWTEREAQ